MTKRITCLTVTMVRHGETDHNTHVPRILQGQSDIPINLNGVQQAETLGWRLKKEHFDHIYSSDLLRAKQTAHEIHKLQSHTPISKDTRLREQDLGDLTGLLWPTAKAVLKSEDRSFEGHIAEHGESNSAFMKRIKDFYMFLIETHLLGHSAVPISADGDSADADDKILGGRARVQPQPMSPIKAGHELPELPIRTAPKQSDDGKVKKGSSKSVPPLPKKPNHQSVLLITHGGVIHKLMDHLLKELNFDLDADHSGGFPKNTSVYRFYIEKVMKEDGDYEWQGHVKLMNCVAHLAGLGKRTEKTGARAPSSRSPWATPLGSRSNSRANSRTASPRGSPSMLRTTKEYGGFVNHTIAQGGPASVVPPATRNKSLGW